MNPFEQLRELQSLVKSPGWMLFAAEVQNQQDQMVVGLVMKPLETLDSALAQEFQKGAIARTAQVMSLPETLIEQLKLDIERTEREDGTGTVGTDRDPDAAA